MDKRRIQIAAGAATGLLGLSVWVLGPSPPAPFKHLLRNASQYSNSGYGGYGSGAVEKKTAPGADVPKTASPAAVPTVKSVEDLYNAGNYKGAQAQAEAVIRANQGAQDVPHRRETVEARSYLAYSEARQKDLKTAQVEFGMLQITAATLPDHGKQRNPTPDPSPGRSFLAGRGESDAQGDGEPLPTFEEDGAFQHAVCTAALGNQKAAEQEYVALMKRYPESPVCQDAIKRIAKMHGGNIPPAAEAVWKQAMKIGQERQKERMREESLCGPECLAEMLRRSSAYGGVGVWKYGGGAAPQSGGMEISGYGSGGSRTGASSRQVSHTSTLPYSHTSLVEGFAREMGATDQGTSMEEMVAGARRHGFRAAKGVALTQKGLGEQKLPVIALVSPGHYVLVESVSAAGVVVWDPDGSGPHQPARRSYGLEEWQRMWRGYAIELRS